MKDILKALKSQQEKSLDAVIVSIITAKGSTPRTTGALMVVGVNGRISGTIGGGMLEFFATNEAVKFLKEKKGAIEKYKLTKNDVANLGMVCGGDVTLLYTFVEANQANQTIISTMEEALSTNQTGWLVLPTTGAGVNFLSTNAVKAIIIDTELEKPLKTGLVATKNGECYIHKISNQSKVYIFGGGHLAQELVPLLTHLDFRCVVTDDRAEFATKELFPNAEEIKVLNYENLENQFNITPRDYIVVLTRGHLGDFNVEVFALKTAAYYIGVVGSKSKVAVVNQKLKDIGFSDHDIKRIKTPIGIEIKSETPAEIAVSIAAELIERRATLGEC